ncbi:MAG: SNF2 helicase associated domain-containing protein, partial [Candidatus Choladocola sp.]|nr:SNF2 helicase associated domain-containing protein [Candidatus Choladocola sp.]
QKLLEQWRRLDRELQQEQQRKLEKEQAEYARKAEKERLAEERAKQKKLKEAKAAEKKALQEAAEKEAQAAAERARAAEEEARRQEAVRAAKRLEREKRKEEQARKREEQRRMAEEAARAEQEKRRAEEARREKLRQEKAEEARKRAEKRQREREAQEQRMREEEKLRAERERLQKAEENKRMRQEKERRETAEKRKAEYSPLGGSWEEDSGDTVSPNGNRAIEELEAYRYFDGAKIYRSVSSTADVVSKGEQLDRQGKIEIQDVTTGFSRGDRRKIGQMIAVGREQNREFPIRIIFEKGGISLFECNCRECSRNYFRQYDTKKTTCPYKMGALKLLKEFLDEHNIGDATDLGGHRLLLAFQDKRASMIMKDRGAKEQSLRLVPRLTRKNGKLSLSFRVGESKLFVIKKLDVFCENVRNSATDTYGSSTEINHDLNNFAENGRKWIRYIDRIVREEQKFQERLTESRYYYGMGKDSVGNTLELFGWRLDEFFENLRDEPVDFEDKDQEGKRKGTLTCRDGNPRITVNISEDVQSDRKEFDGIRVSGSLPELYHGIDTAYYISENHLNRVEQGFLTKVEPLEAIAEDDGFSFRVGRNRISEFYDRVLPQLREIADITETDPERFRSYVLPEARVTFYLDVEANDAVCQLRFTYGDKEVSALDLISEEKSEQIEPFRDIPMEDEILFRTMQWLPMVDLKRDVLCCGQDEEKIYSLMKNGTDRLMEMGEVQCTKRFLGYHAVKRAKVAVGVSLSSGLLELDISTEDIPPAELLEILKSYRTRKKYYRMKDGSFVDLEDPSIEMLAELSQAMNLKDREFLKGKLKLPAYRTLYLDRLLEENESVYSSRNSRFKEVVKEFKTVRDSDFEEPESLSKIMRKYQKDGYKWLRTLETCQFGGILADDMGLGKTLQVIAVLLAAKEEGKGGTSLVVTPASLVFNWGAEFEKYAPGLTVSLVTGTQEERQKKIAAYQESDVLVTSYDLLKRDIALYEDTEFSYEIIDEAQYIKNHTTAAAKAVKVIHSRIRFALTGTPIENRLSELWSIFDYLMPGFLYNYETFRKEMETPIAKNNDEKAMARLQKMVGPFILRRLKEDVLKDLPEKLEEFRYVRLGSTQQKVYDGQVVHMKEQIAAQDGAEFEKNKLRILAELTRLRQICCDPSLCFENYRGETAKLEACLELIQSAMDGGHRMLLFSQFTSMLEILQRELDRLKIPYFTITGSVSKEKRLELVRQFNEGDVPVFLISLKAGGVGLNLTGADVVIHYDPWWNLAAQNQATDRAHRIGQSKKVTVYKLIARHTIEEKIQKLQETKKNLADQVMSGESSSLGSMSREEILQLLEV